MRKLKTTMLDDKGHERTVFIKVDGRSVEAVTHDGVYIGTLIGDHAVEWYGQEPDLSASDIIEDAIRKGDA